MKFLTVASLMFSAVALTAMGQANVETCTAGTRIFEDLTVKVNTDLRNYRGTNCETDPNVVLTYDCTGAPNGFGITASYSDSIIGTNGALVLKGVESDKVMMTAPILIRVERVQFESDAVLYVYGHFPTSSLVSINNCHFNVGIKNKVLSSLSGNFVSPITFGDGVNEIQMFGNTQFTIYDNTIVAEDRTGGTAQYEVYGAYFNQDMYMADGAGMLFRRNKVTVSARSRSVGVYCTRYAFSLGNYTFQQIIDNTFTVSNGILFQTPSLVTSGAATGNADFSRNTGNLNPIHSSGTAIQIGPMNVTGSSVISIADNTFTNTPNDQALSARFYVAGPLHIRQSASLYIWFNTMTILGGSTQMNFGATVTAEQNGKVWFVGNNFFRPEPLTITLPPVSLFGLVLKDNGNVAISQNKVGSQNSNNQPLFITVSSSSSDVSRSGAGTFDLCRNTWYGSPFATDAILANAISPRIRSMVTPLDNCPAEIVTTTPVPTTAATLPTIPTIWTTVYDNRGTNGAEGRQITALAAGASAVVAAAVVLLL